MSRILAYLVVMLAVSLSVSVNMCSSQRKEKNRLSDNQRSLMEDATYYRTKDSLSAASVERLTLSNSELKRYCGDLVKEFDALSIKVKRLQSVSRTATKTEVEVKTEVRDSIVYRAGRIDTLRCISYSNPYVLFSGCESSSTFSGHIESRDTLIHVVHRVPKKLWFISWGTKAIRQEVVSKNPYSKITYTEYIELR